MESINIKTFSKLILKINIGLICIALVVLLILQKYTHMAGLFLGGITSCVTFVMHVVNASKMGVSITNPVKNAIGNTLLRLLISAIAIVISLFVSWIDLIWTFIGLLVIKVVMIVTSIVLEIKNRKGGERT